MVYRSCSSTVVATLTRRCCVGWALVLYAIVGQAAAKPPFSYNRDVRPILAEHCFKCHGPDPATREGDLRLDEREAALRVMDCESPDQSELLRRVTSHDPDERMPPAHLADRLSPANVAILRTWIEKGAVFEPHWSFVPPERPAVPTVQAAEWPRSPIDHFVLATVESVGHQVAPPGDRRSLIRRLTLDLTGLPPTPEEVEAFLADDQPRADERLVDRLLASPRYGEHMAVAWLDLARYADTHGYGVDSYRIMWQWRDWVIRALNENMPFDQFTIEQLAGDLLPEPTLDQLVATAFNRNHPIQYESGSVDEEFRVENVADRVNTTATTWLGLTFACARCHSHKYDPISHEEYFRFFAFFNTVDEKGVPAIYGDVNSHRGNTAPVVETPQYGLLPEVNASSPVVPTIMVMREMPTPRETFLLERGEYDRPSGSPLTPGLPAALGWLEPAPDPPNRLALARWLVSDRNPLTARVVVNRSWQHFFGRGIVATSDDFGIQGELPSHPELLDWLAREFVEGGWNVKRLHRQIVLSATYQQANHITPWHQEHDPDNRLLSRGATTRLPAEVIRDSSLSVSGLLVNELGGPPVRPYQPPGLWAEANYLSEREYVPDTGSAQYRRSIYTYWRRMIPPPTLQVLDAPSRDVCVSRRIKTNTPLQALALLNDPTFVETARKLAERMMRVEPPDRVSLAFRLVLAREPSANEAEVLRHLYGVKDAEFQNDSQAALALLQVGAAPYDEALPAAELAAWTIVARVVLNLEETISKP